MSKWLFKILIIVTLLAGFSGALHAQTVAAGLEHSVVVRADGSVWIWGANQLGQLGDGGRSGNTVPIKIQNLPLMQTVATGAYHTLALSQDGSVWSWGGNKFGQLGNGNQIDTLTPQPITGLPPITAIAAGFYHSIALADDGSVWSWGDNSVFQLGVDGTQYSAIPLSIGRLSQVDKITSTLWNSYAMTVGGDIFWWGQNPSGQPLASELLLFDRSWSDIMPSNMAAAEYIDNATGETLLIASGMEHSLMMRADGSVTRSGGNVGEALGGAPLLLKNEPVLWTGGVTVHILPEEAQQEVSWRVAGSHWLRSGETAQVEAGYHTVEFVSSGNWSAPGTQQVDVVEGERHVLNGSYTPKKGAVQVTISPATVADEGAMWRLDGGEWQVSGSTLDDLSPGEYTLEYSSVMNWGTPLLDDPIIYVEENKTQQLSGEYKVLVSAVSVMIKPDYAVADGAQWRLSGQEWRNSGDVVNNLAPGHYTIEFLSTPSWRGGEPVSVNVKLGALYRFTHYYLDEKGSITVNLFPLDAVSEGARWRLNGGVWRTSGERVGDLASGSYLIEYAPLTGWSGEGVENQPVVQGDGISLNKVYRRETGSVQVNISPAEAVDAGAQWRLSGSAWRNSGDRVNNLEPATYSIEFNSPTGWSGGAAQTVVVEQDNLERVTRDYLDLAGSLQFTLTPLAVAEAGAQWRLADGEWYDSADTMSGIVAGEYTVEFSLPDGWQGISQQQVIIEESTFHQPSQTFEQLTGGVQVSLAPQQAIDAGARWRVNNGIWRLSGETVAGLIPGRQVIEFSAVDGWTGATQAELTVLHSNVINYQNHYELDTDGDSIADRFDLDDDGDGISDEFELANGMDPLDASDALDDRDGDGLSNLDEYLAGSDLTQDSLAPQLTIPADQVLPAQGYFTWVELGAAEAFDVLDGTVPTEASLRAPFKAGSHQVVWQAQDRAGNLAQAQQTVAVIPQLNFAPDQSVVEGDSAVVELFLSGSAADYPVEIEYKITGSADVDDHDARDGSVVIEQGISGVISFNLWNDSVIETDEQVVIELVRLRNAVAGSKTTHRVTIAEQNLPANVTLQAYQNGKAVTTLLKGGGEVEIMALIDDAGDLHQFDWSASDGLIQLIAQIEGGSMRFDPEQLGAGEYQISVVVTDIGTPQHQIIQQLNLNLLAETPLFFTTQDSDGDGIDDLSEGLEDSDGDGIAAYLDTELQQPVLPLMGVQDPTLVMSAEAGLKLALGSTAMAAGRSMPHLLEQDLIEDDQYDYPGGVIDFTIKGMANHGGSALVVIPQTVPIPENGRYRVYRDGRWYFFESHTGNHVASAPAVNGFCAAPGSRGYSEGLTEGDQCLQLQIEDGGVNDSDGNKNGTIRNIGGMTEEGAPLTPNSSNSAPSSSGGGGCTVGNGDSRDFTLPIILLLSLLYLWRRRQQPV